MTPKSILTWLQAIEKQNGYEILLVQTIRNSLMGAGVPQGADGSAGVAVPSPTPASEDAGVPEESAIGPKPETPAGQEPTPVGPPPENP